MKGCPALGTAYFVKLGKYVVINEEGGDEVVQIALRFLANLLRAEKDIKVTDKRMLDETAKIAVVRRRLAKLAVRGLVLGASNTGVVKDVLEVCFSSSLFVYSW
jgi:sister-chromatid-cohesion protein PDS5